MSKNEQEIVIKLNLDEILTKVANDVITEILTLIGEGKNVANQSLHPKKNGETPVFFDTGLMLNSIETRLVDGGVEIFVSNEGRSQIMDYLNLRHDDWMILEESEYIINYADQRLQYYLDEKFPD